MCLKSAFLLISLTIVEAERYGNNHVPVRRDSHVVATNFQDPNVTLLAPAFLSPETVPASFANGSSAPTSESVMNYFLQSLSIRNDWMTYQTVDYRSEEGRAFRFAYLSKSSPTSNSNVNTIGKLRVWLQGGVHGNEPAGDQSLLALLGKMDTNQAWTASLLERMDIMILLRYNLDGVAYFSRNLASKLDPNRDHIRLARQQTRDIKRTFTGFGPHIAVDMHEFSASTTYGGSYKHGADAMYSAAKNLNINANIRRMSEDLFAVNIGKDLEAAGLRWEPYVTGSSSPTAGSSILFKEASSDPKIGRTAMALTQSITFLCETRGIGLADQEFRRRTVTALTMAESIIQTAADNAENVLSTVEAGIEEFVNSQEDIVVTDYANTMDRKFTMIEIGTGSLVQVPVKFASTTPTTANLTRARPEAYLIPKAWASLVSRLSDSGVEVQRLDYAFRGTVEALEITSLAFEDTYYEGVVPVTVTTTTVNIEVQLPVGSYLVNTRQRNAGLAFVALEPENIDSYVSFNIIPVAERDEYPVYRVVPS